MVGQQAAQQPSYQAAVLLYNYMQLQYMIIRFQRLGNVEPARQNWYGCLATLRLNQDIKRFQLC
jgi:hypothetical protein